MEAVPAARGSRDTRHRLRVLVVASATLVAETIRESLGSRGFNAVVVPVPTSSARLRELTRVVAERRPAVGLVVTDLVDPVEVMAIDRLLAGVPLRWLVVTGEPAGPQWGALLEAGAAAVLPATASLDELGRALLWVAMGRDVMPSDLLARVVQEWRDAKDAELELAERLETLSPREMDVLRRLSEGQAVKEIAEEISVTEGTVRSQVKSILRKLGVRSQLAGVAAYWELEELRRRSRRPSSS